MASPERPCPKEATREQVRTEHGDCVAVRSVSADVRGGLEPRGGLAGRFGQGPSESAALPRPLAGLGREHKPPRAWLGSGLVLRSPIFGLCSGGGVQQRGPECETYSQKS